MESLGISVWWPKKGRNRDPLVGVKLNGYQETEELKKVILVIEYSLRGSFPRVPLKRLDSVREFLKPGKGRQEVRLIE